jgi:hypothetical protein
MKLMASTITFAVALMTSLGSYAQPLDNTTKANQDLNKQFESILLRKTTVQIENAKDSKSSAAFKQQPVVTPARLQKLDTSHNGGVATGGGNLCYINGRPVLLELADLQTQMTEPGIQFQTSKMTKLYGFSAFEKIDTAKVKDRVDAILNANERVSPIVVSWLRKIAPSIAFSFVSANIDVPVRANTSNQPDCQSGNVKASMLFFPPMMAFVDVRQLNALDLDSQAGLVLHESGRLLQLLLDRNAMNDAELQNMVRVLYDVYRGQRNETIDQDKFLMAFENKISLQIQSGDLCLSDVTYTEAQSEVYRQKGLIPPKNSKFFSTEFYSEILSEQEKIKAGLPAVMKQACALQSEVLTWEEMKDELSDLLIQANNLPVRTQEVQVLELRLQKALRQPLAERSLKQAVAEDVAGAIDQLNILMATAQLPLSILSSNAEDYFAHKNDRALSKENRQALQNIELKSCYSRQNLNEWLKVGAPEIFNGADTSLSEKILQPNPKCQ